MLIFKILQWLPEKLKKAPPSELFIQADIERNIIITWQL